MSIDISVKMAKNLLKRKIIMKGKAYEERADF